MVVTNMYMYITSRLYCNSCTIIHKVNRYLFIRSMYKRPLGLPSRRLLFSSKWKSVKNLQGGIILFYRTFGACHLGLCTTESATTCLWSQTHGRCFEMKSPNISTCPRNLVNTRNSLSKSSAPPLHRRPCSIPWCSNRNESCEHSSKAHCFSRV